MSLTRRLWDSIPAIYKKMLAHPFLEGLCDGSLPEEAFRFYVIQDALYLREFARGLALLAAKAETTGALLMFVEHARDAILVERALHESFFKTWGLPPESVEAVPMAPDNVLYTSYLLATTHERPYAEALGAFLPCYWIYWEVGKELEKRGSPNPLYQQWIATYAAEAFAAVVRQVLTEMDAQEAALTPRREAAVRERFIMTARFEYLFWDMAYRRRGFEI